MEKALKVRDIVLNRTFRFICYKQACGPMLPLWIDSLSIEQEETCHGLESLFPHL
jgi:hypothetical protein